MPLQTACVGQGNLYCSFEDALLLTDEHRSAAAQDPRGEAPQGCAIRIAAGGPLRRSEAD